MVSHEPHHLRTDTALLKQFRARLGVVQQQVYPLHPRRGCCGTADPFGDRGGKLLEEHNHDAGRKPKIATLPDVMHHTRENDGSWCSGSSEVLCNGDEMMLVVR